MVISGLLIYFLPKVLVFLFKSQNKDSFELVFLIFILICIIGISYVFILLTKKQNRSDLKIILVKVKLIINKKNYGQFKT